MKHPFLSLLLGLGVIAGTCAGFSHLRHQSSHWGSGHQRFEDRITDICERAVDRRLEERTGSP